MKRLPDFLVVGAAKSGTTSLYRYLHAHPDVYLSKTKEIRYFSSMPGDFAGPGDEAVNASIVKSLSEYEKFFEGRTNEKAAGDVSPDYLYYYDTAVNRIRRELGEVKIIIILRNPVDRAYSQFMHFVRDGRETLSFSEAIESVGERKKRHWEWAWQYLDVGLYYRQVKAYLDNFGDIRVFLYDDFVADPRGVLKECFSFISVDDSFVPDNFGERYNVSGVPRVKLIKRLMDERSLVKDMIKPLIPGDARRRLKGWASRRNVKKSSMTAADRAYLIDYYKDDVVKLGGLLKRDLTHWLK